jgi:hypothetical protein
MLINIPAPLIISSRLMAAYKIEGVGTLHLEVHGRNHENRLSYHYVVEDAEGTVLDEGTDLSSGVGSDPDYLAMMETLLSFLGAAAERGESAEGYPPALVEWAEQNSDELQMAAMEIDTWPGNHHEGCTSCLAGITEPHLQTF